MIIYLLLAVSALMLFACGFLLQRQERKMQRILKDTQMIIDIQSSNGNWNYDGYNHGYLNGMILIQSFITDQSPKFRDPPERFLIDKERANGQ